MWCSGRNLDLSATRRLLLMSPSFFLFGLLSRPDDAFCFCTPASKRQGTQLISSVRSHVRATIPLVSVFLHKSIRVAGKYIFTGRGGAPLCSLVRGSTPTSLEGGYPIFTGRGVPPFSLVGRASPFSLVGRVTPIFTGGEGYPHFHS